MDINHKHSGGIDLMSLFMLTAMANILEAEAMVQTNGDVYIGGSPECRSLVKNNNDKCPTDCRSLVGCEKVRRLVQLRAKNISDPALDNQILQAKTFEELGAIPFPMLCQNCGKQINTEDNFCPYCGNLIQKTETIEPKTNER